MEVKTKYNIGDEVYILDGYNVYRVKILGVRFEQHGVSPSSILYFFGCFPMKKESECFTTKEKLINHLSNIKI